jgi:hypothetical protein
VCAALQVSAQAQGWLATVTDGNHWCWLNWPHSVADLWAIGLLVPQARAVYT